MIANDHSVINTNICICLSMCIRTPIVYRFICIFKAIDMIHTTNRFPISFRFYVFGHISYAKFRERTRAQCNQPQFEPMQFAIFLLEFYFVFFFTIIVIAEFVILFIEFLKYFTIQCNLSTKYIYVRCCCSFVWLFFCFDLAIDIWFTEFMHLHYTNTHSHSLAL